MLNRVMVQGRIAFDFEVKGSEGKEVVSFMVSNQRPYKKEGEQYYPEDLIQCKLFGARATAFAKFFSKGSNVIVEGQLRKDDDYTNKDGVEVKGGLFVNVTDFHFVDKASSAGGNAAAPTPAKVNPAIKPAPTVAAPKAAVAAPKVAVPKVAVPKANF